jgi:hypothetical protein
VEVRENTMTEHRVAQMLNVFDRHIVTPAIKARALARESGTGMRGDWRRS